MNDGLTALQCLCVRKAARLDLRVAGCCDAGVAGVTSMPQTAPCLTHNVAFPGLVRFAETDKRHKQLVWGLLMSGVLVWWRRC